MARQLLAFAVLLVLGVGVDRAFADEPERIIRGSNAVLGEFPYQVALRSTGGEHFCGGSLITTGHVLTAAHCLTGWKAEHMVVATGTIDGKGGEIHKVRLIRTHPGYEARGTFPVKNDIAVLTLEDSVVENQYQKVITIASSVPPSGTPLLVSGWGLMGVSGPTAPILQKGIVFIRTNDECREVIPEEYPLYDTHVCATNRDDGIGVCRGDSGGPLVYNNHLVGVVSWAYPCNEGMPDVYTKASEFYEFIRESIVLSYEQ